MKHIGINAKVASHVFSLLASMEGTTVCLEIPKWAEQLNNPSRLRGAKNFRAVTKSEVAHKWSDCLITPLAGGTQHFKAEEKMRNGPQVGGLAT